MSGCLCEEYRGTGLLWEVMEGTCFRAQRSALLDSGYACMRQPTGAAVEFNAFGREGALGSCRRVSLCSPEMCFDPSLMFHFHAGAHLDEPCHQRMCFSAFVCNPVHVVGVLSFFSS